MKGKTYLYFIIGTVVVTPILLNILLNKQNPLSSIEVIGGPMEWLSFYGSFLGGVLATIVGLLTIYCESRRNALNIMIHEQYAFVEKLRFELADIVSSFDYWYLGSISLNISNKSNKEAYDIICNTQSEYLNRLNHIYREVTQKGNAFGLIFSKRSEAHINGFISSYQACYKAYGEDIDKMTKLISEIKTPDDIPMLVDSLNKFNNRSKDQNDNLNNKLFKDAQQWIKIEEDVLKLMKSEQNKLCPKISFK